jgi:hypothetical protein
MQDMLSFRLFAGALNVNLEDVLRHKCWLRKTRYEVEKNISRLAADWRDRVAVCIGGLVRQAERHALDELESLEELAANQASKAPELHAAIQQVKGFRESLGAGDKVAQAPR